MAMNIALTSPTRAMWLRWGPPLVSAIALAALAAFGLRDLFSAGADHLPGTDTGNLYAFEVFTRASLASRQLPFWNPYTFGGTPHFADSQATVLYPPAVVLRWVLQPKPYYFPAMIVLHSWLAGLGGLFLGRVIGLRWITATAVGVATMLGGSVAPWIHNGHLLLLFCYAWVPWTFGLAITAVRRKTARPSLALAAVLVLQLLSGYPQGLVYIWGAVAGYFLFSVAWPEHDGASRQQVLLQFGLLWTATIGLAAFELFPMVRLASQAGRTVGLPYSTAVAEAWNWPDLSSFFFPGPLYSDRVAYVGWILAAFAPAAVVDRSRRRLVIILGVIVALAVAVALGDHLRLYRLHYAMFPGFRIPGRALIVATPAVALLGGIGVERCLRSVAAREWRLVLAAVAVAMATVTVSVVVSQHLSADTSSVSWRVIATAVVAAAVALVTARWSMQVALLAVLAGIAVDLEAHVAGAVTFTDESLSDHVRRSLAPDGGRIASACADKVTTADLMAAGIPTVTAIGGIYLRGFADYNDVLTSEGPFPARRDLWDAANVTRVVSCDPLTIPALTLEKEVPPFKIYRNGTAWPRAVWTCGLEPLTRTEVFDRLRNGRYENGQLVRTQPVNVRWKAGTSDVERQSREKRYGLSQGERDDGTTWRYQLHDSAPANVEALLRDDAVDDTNGIDRQRAQVAAPLSEGAGAIRTEMLLGTSRCTREGRVEVTVRDRSDGVVRAQVQSSSPGFVVFSEGYYPERKAYVDGVEVHGERTNLAFVAVPVPAGEHDVELRFVPTALYAGLGTTGITALVWSTVAAYRRRQQRATLLAADIR